MMITSELTIDGVRDVDDVAVCAQHGLSSIRPWPTTRDTLSKMFRTGFRKPGIV